MKNVAIAGVVAAALCLTGVAQRASAQDCRRGFDVSANVGLTFGVHWTPMRGNNNCDNSGYGSYGMPCQGGYGPYGYPGYQAGLVQTAPPPVAPTATPLPTPKSKTEGADVQNVGYSYPAGYYYDYNYANGYPYYQGYGYGYDYGYGYGR